MDFAPSASFVSAECLKKLVFPSLCWGTFNDEKKSFCLDPISSADMSSNSYLNRWARPELFYYLQSKLMPSVRM